jgi:N-acetylmuramoyl-L-alanine amidase
MGVIVSDGRVRVVKSCLTGVIGAGLLMTGAHGCMHGRRTGGGPTTTRAVMPLSEAMALVDERGAWEDHAALAVPRVPTEKYLKGLTICIDPGHGGDDGAKSNRGAGGIREKDMNLRVGLLLQRLLKDAGVTVVMTRTGDETVSLPERAAIANRAKGIARERKAALATAPTTGSSTTTTAAAATTPSTGATTWPSFGAQGPDVDEGADLFVSIHHNTSENRERNFTSVWYHGEVDSAEASLDAGRHVARELGEHLRTQVGLTSELLSDELMYKTGFAVLRASKVPAVLLECSFYTNEAEERRLADAGYNLRQAWAIYAGLCEWAYEGRPSQPRPEVRVEGDQVVITTTLNDGLPGWWGGDRNRIITSSVSAEFDGKRVPFDYDAKTHRLTARADVPGGVESTEHVVGVHFANLYKHHNWPQRYGVTVVKDVQGNAAVSRVEALGNGRSGRGRELMTGTTPPSTAPSTTTPVSN